MKPIQTKTMQVVRFNPELKGKPVLIAGTDPDKAKVLQTVLVSDVEEKKIHVIDHRGDRWNYEIWDFVKEGAPKTSHWYDLQLVVAEFEGFSEFEEDEEGMDDETPDED